MTLLNKHKPFCGIKSKDYDIEAYIPYSLGRGYKRHHGES